MQITITYADIIKDDPPTNEDYEFELQIEAFLMNECNRKYGAVFFKAYIS